MAVDPVLMSLRTKVKKEDAVIAVPSIGDSSSSSFACPSTLHNVVCQMSEVAFTYFSTGTIAERWIEGVTKAIACRATTYLLSTPIAANTSANNSTVFHAFLAKRH
jgi:hypothetical protein